MDFHQLLAKMQELDRPVPETVAQECGDQTPMSMTPPMPPKADTPPPSLSVNLNAQGMDNIEQIMKLITKVNPDAAPQHAQAPMSLMPPSVSAMPPLKMLPDYDADNDMMPGGEKDMPGDDMSKDIMVKMGDDGKDDDEGSQPGGLATSLDRDGDGDHDMDDHELEKDDDSESDDEKKKEAWDNEPEEIEQSIDYMNNKLAGGMNKPKDTFARVSPGDNPMQRVREDADSFRAEIKAELQRRLAEAKGAK